jgi:hypothetical protein
VGPVFRLVDSWAGMSILDCRSPLIFGFVRRWIDACPASGR